MLKPTFTIPRFAGMLVLLLLLLWGGCSPKEMEPTYLLVNGFERDYVLILSSDQQLVSVEVLCDREWSCLAQENASAWMTFSKTKDPGAENSWFFVMDVQEMTEGNDYRRVEFAFVSGSVSRRLIVMQSPPDPMRDVTVAGAYNVPGGNLLFDSAKDQWSCLRFGNELAFRVLNPAEGRVVTISGIPANLREGSVSTVSYRRMEKGITLASGSFSNTGVIRLTDDMIWLRAAPDVYFILKIPRAGL